MKKGFKLAACVLAVCALSCSFVGCSSDDGNQWLKQLTCEHEWDEGEVTKEATCTKEGVLTITCDLCGKTKTKKVALAEHNEKLLLKTEATCEEDGEELYECEDCGELRKKIIEAPGHSPIKLVGKEATCDTPGLTDGSICEECEEVLKEQKEIPAAHTYENGTCTNCGVAEGE